MGRCAFKVAIIQIAVILYFDIAITSIIKSQKRLGLGIIRNANYSFI